MSKLSVKITDYKKAKRCMSTFMLKRAEAIEKAAAKYEITLSLPTLRYLMFMIFERENPNAWRGALDGQWPILEVRRFLAWIELVPLDNIEAIKTDLAKMEITNEII